MELRLFKYFWNRSNFKTECTRLSLDLVPQTYRIYVKAGLFKDIDAARSELGDKALLASAKALVNTVYRLIVEEGLLERHREIRDR